MFERARRFQALALAAIFAFQGCDGQDPAGPMGGEGEGDEQSPVLEGSSAELTLSRGRTVEWLRWDYPSGSATPTKKVNRGPAVLGGGTGAGYVSQPVGWLFLGCLVEEHLRNNGASVPVPADAKCQAITTPYMVPFSHGFSAQSQALALTCAGHWALTIAEGQPIYLMQTGYVGVINTKPEVTQLARDFWGDTVAGSRPAVSYPAPSPSDAATWALVAADLFREASLLSARVLDPVQCAPESLSATVTSSSGQTVSLMDNMAATLTDSLTGMVEAAEKAQTLVAAASAAKLSSASDYQTGTIEAWRSRHDSRLEAASVFLPVAEEAYQATQGKALWEMAKPLVTGDKHNYYYTTLPELAEPGYSPNRMVGYVYPPELPQPPDTDSLVTYRRADGLMITTDNSGSSHVGGATIVRQEGWTIPTIPGPYTSYSHYRCGANTAADPYRYAWIAAGTTAPTGCSGISDSNRVFTMPFETPNPDVAGSLGKFPVLLATTQSEGDKRAETILRDMRIDPRIAGARTSSSVANDMLYAMQAEYKSLYANVTSGLTLLDKLGIKLADIERACARIEQTAKVMGLTIVDDPAHPGAAPNAMATPPYGKPKLVFGTRRPAVPTDPAVIYARTGGRVTFPKYALPGYASLSALPADGLPVGPAYARSSIISTLDYVRFLLTNASGQYDAVRYDARYTPATHEMLKSLLAWDQQFVSSRVRLTTATLATTAATNIESMTLVVQGLGYGSEATAKSELAIWLGEAGLECALNGQVGGAPCNAATYKFLQNSPWTVGSATDADIGKRNALSIPVARTESPTGAISTNVPVFVTRTLAGKTSLVTAFYPPRPAAAGVAGNASIWLTPYSEYVATTLGEALAASPDEPEKTALSCAGVPTNVKVKLEDELSEAVEGKDGIESSFAHYLSKAKEAALRADDLGDQMVQQGLSMDMRSEEARDGLEDLCGGVINVGRLESAACGGSYNCDVVKLLQNSANITDPQLRGDAEGLKRCLGIGDPPVNAILGDQDACVWNATYGGKTYPTCVWPTDAAGQPIGGNANVPPECIFIRGSDPCPTIVVPPGVTLSYSPATKLNMSVSGAGLSKSAAPSATPRFMCGNLLKLRRHLATVRRLSPTTFSLNPDWENFDWVRQGSLLDIAQAMGVDRDEYNFPTVTFAGAALVSVGSATSGPASPITTSTNNAQWNRWPCAPHALLGTGPGQDAAAAAFCTGSQGANRSLVCGGFCGPQSTASDQEWLRANTQAGALGRRLAKAVSALKGVTGASFRNFVANTVTVGGGLQFSTQISDAASLVSTGPLPMWHPFAPGQQAARSRDRSALCWHTASNQSVCSLRASAKGTPPMKAPGADWYGGWPENPYGVWVEGNCKATFILPNGSQAVGSKCGDIPRLLKGQANVVDLRFKSCGAPIPDDLCAYDDPSMCGERLRGSHYWIKAQGPIAPVPESVRAFLACTESNEALTGEGVWDAITSAASSTSCVPPSSADVQAAMRSIFLSDLYFYTLSFCDLEGATNTEWIGSAVPADVMLDALDLACAAKSRQQLGCETLLDESYAASDASDFPTMAEMARCAADRVEGNLEQMLLPGIPKSVADDIAGNSVVQTFPENRGGFGQTVALLAGEIITMRQHVSSVVQAIRDLSLGLQRSQAELTALGLQRDIKDVELYIEGLNAEKIDASTEIAMVRSRQAISSNITSCLSALAQASGDWFKNATGRSAGDWMSSTAICGNSIAQVAMETKIQDLTADIAAIDQETVAFTKKAIELGQQVTDQQRQIVLLDASAKLNETMDRINTALIALQASHTQVQSYLAQLDTQRNQASRLAAKVLMLDNDQLGRQYSVNSAMRARMNTLRVRYERARDNAIAASYLARRAVEQKLGVDLSLMTKDMTGVAAPKKWVDKLCTMSGINYSEIRSGGPSDPSMGTMGANAAPIDDVVPAAYDYADGYVGDFVTLLENFVEAYRIDYPFQDGDALAVVSLKDELLRVRRENAECPAVPGPNLLYYTNGIPADGTGESTWEYPCAVTGSNPTGTELVVGAPAAAAGSSPFACYTLPGTTIKTCPRPEAQAFSVGTSATACIPMDAENPEAQDASVGRAYRFVGSDCGVAVPGFCTDLSGNGASMAVAGASAPTVTTPAGGIGNRAALLSTNFQGLSIDTSVATAEQYTVTVVSALTGAPGNGSWWFHRLWQSATSAPGQTGMVYLYLQNVAGVMRVGVHHYINNLDASGNVIPGGPVYSATAPLSSFTGPWVISLRTNSVTRLSELWVNGQRVAALTGTFQVHPSSLDAQWVAGVDSGVSSQLKVADLQAHRRALSGLEISRLHQDLGAIYGVTVLSGNTAVSSVPETRQEVVLAAGSYLLSWYQYVGGFGTLAASSAGVSISDAGVAIPYFPAVNAANASMATTSAEDPSLTPGWARYFGTFDVKGSSLVTVGLRLPPSATSMTIAGLQLESIDAFSSYAPAAYFPTGATLMAQRSSCEDVDGSKFRGSKYWSYGCEYYCPPGTGLDCAAGGDPSGLPKNCFYETKFPISLEAIEKGDLLPEAGFARGNFNYRFTDLAVNIVGTQVKNCELSETPSSCYANNHVLYSVRHDEPFRVRNYNGDVFDSQLYPGNIQQAQALLAERYITNPISSADRNLLADYWRGEMSGRPMDGNFRLRIYDDEGLDWSAIEDVQIMMHYRYWTRER